MTSAELDRVAEETPIEAVNALYKVPPLLGNGKH